MLCSTEQLNEGCRISRPTSSPRTGRCSPSFALGVTSHRRTRIGRQFASCSAPTLVRRAGRALTTARASWSKSRADVGTGGRARAAGLQVLACPGPATNPRCPALSGHACPLAANADAIVVAPPVEDAARRALLDAHARLHDGVPICVELPAHATVSAPPGAVTTPPDASDQAIARLVQRLAVTRRPLIPIKGQGRDSPAATRSET